MYKFKVGRVINKGDDRMFIVAFTVTISGKDMDHAHKRVREMIAESGLISFPVEG